eukprot:6471960-Amphidinium_carterae.1
MAFNPSSSSRVPEAEPSPLRTLHQTEALESFPQFWDDTSNEFVSQQETIPETANASTVGVAAVGAPLGF